MRLQRSQRARASSNWAALWARARGIVLTIPMQQALAGRRRSSYTAVSTRGRIPSQVSRTLKAWCKIYSRLFSLMVCKFIAKLAPTAWLQKKASLIKLCSRTTILSQSRKREAKIKRQLATLRSSLLASCPSHQRPRKPSKEVLLSSNCLMLQVIQIISLETKASQTLNKTSNSRKNSLCKCRQPTNQQILMEMG